MMMAQDQSEARSSSTITAFTITSARRKLSTMEKPPLAGLPTCDRPLISTLVVGAAVGGAMIWVSAGAPVGAAAGPCCAIAGLAANASMATSMTKKTGASTRFNVMGTPCFARGHAVEEKRIQN